MGFGIADAPVGAADKEFTVIKVQLEPLVPQLLVAVTQLLPELLPTVTLLEVPPPDVIEAPASLIQ